MIYRTVPNCRVCQHPQRKKIEDIYLMKPVGETFQAFKTKIHLEFGVPEESFKTHFRGLARGGKSPIPHFSTENVSNAIERNELIRQVREEVELKGIKIA